MDVEPAYVVQEQMDAYNAQDLERFVACYAEDIALFALPKVIPFLEGKAALRHRYRKRFESRDLCAQCMARIAVDQFVTDHERVTGIASHPIEAIVTYRVVQGRITHVWFAGL